MTTFDFSQFERNSTSNFQQTFTIEEVKEAAGGQPLRVLPSKDKDTCFFACGRIRGYVANALATKLKNKQPVGTIVVSHVVSEKFDGLMLHEQNESGAIKTF